MKWHDINDININITLTLYFVSPAGHILGSSVASSLATLPFSVLRRLYDGTPLSTDDGVLLRRMTLDVGCLHLVLACLSVLSHHTPRGAPQEVRQRVLVRELLVLLISGN